MLTIKTPADTTDLVATSTVRDVWEYVIGIPDGMDKAAVAAASQSASLWCHRKFVRQTYIEKLQPTFRSKLLLSAYPIVSVTSVTSMDEPVSSSDYDIISESGILMKNNMIPWAGPARSVGFLQGSYDMTDLPLSITVEYVAGWVTQPMVDLDGSLVKTIPADLEMAIALFAKTIMRELLGLPTGEVQTVRMGPVTVSHDKVDSFVSSGSGYWATAIGDPSTLWLPLGVRRVLANYISR